MYVLITVTEEDRVGGGEDRSGEGVSIDRSLR